MLLISRSREKSWRVGGGGGGGGSSRGDNNVWIKGSGEALVVVRETVNQQRTKTTCLEPHVSYFNDYCSLMSLRILADL